MAKKKKNLSVSDLEQMLHQKMSQLEALIDRRKKLQEQIAGLDAEIQNVAGATTGTGTKSKSKLVAKPKQRRRRVKNAKSLSSVVKQVLTGKKDGLSPADIEKAVLATGYKTKSKSFRTMIYQCLGKSEEIAQDKKTKKYRLA